MPEEGGLRGDRKSKISYLYVFQHECGTHYYLPIQLMFPPPYSQVAILQKRNHDQSEPVTEASFVFARPYFPVSFVSREAHNVLAKTLKAMCFGGLLFLILLWLMV